MSENNEIIELDENINEINDNKEVILDGEDSLSASMSCDESGYPMYNIKVERGFYTVYELKRKYNRKDRRIILDSDFQRESIWEPLQKAELIESILMGLPLPIFYFNQDKLGKLIVVDGRQRLTALFEFMSNEWSLKNLKILSELNGRMFEDLSPVAQTQIEDYQIQAHVIQPSTPDKVKFDIFERVNRAGTQLNRQEIRNALYQGKATVLLNRIVNTKEFSQATGDAFKKNARMKDKYLVTRFIAFELYNNHKIKVNSKAYKYKNDIDELLGLAMEYINYISDNEVELIEKMVMCALKNSYEILGENAFRMFRSNGARSPINMNVFEVLMHLMSVLIDKNLVYKSIIKDKVEKMKCDENFQNSIRYHRDSWQNVELRYKMVDKILEELNDIKN